MRGYILFCFYLSRNWGYNVKHMQFGGRAITLAFAFALASWTGSALGLSLEEALVQSLKNSNKIASSRDIWIAARESVFSSNTTKESSLKYSGSGSLSETDSGSGYTGSNSYSNKVTFSKNIFEIFKSYFVIFKTYDFGRYILTSSYVSVGTVLITLLFAIPAAYAVARLNFFGKTFLSTSILIIYMFPAIVLVIPLYTVFSQLGLRNSVEGLLIVYTATTLPVAIYMLQGYFKSIPKEIEEAGLIDGQNWFGIIIKIIIPLSLPAIASVSLYVFMIAWNEFLFSLMFLDNPKTFTLSRAINHLTGDAETPRQYLMAGSVVVTLPILLIFIYFEKYLVSGLTAGSVKG